MMRHPDAEILKRSELRRSDPVVRAYRAHEPTFADGLLPDFLFAAARCLRVPVGRRAYMRAQVHRRRDQRAKECVRRLRSLGNNDLVARRWAWRRLYPHPIGDLLAASTMSSCPDSIKGSKSSAR
jgi:hypothetical protein